MRKKSRGRGAVSQHPATSPQGGASEALAGGVLPAYIQRLLRKREDGTPVILVTGDGALVDGNWIDLEAYRERFEDRHRIEVTVSGGGLDA